MSVARHRREASKRLGLDEAQGQDEIAAASVELGTLFSDNIEFTINVLKAYGGLEAKFEPMTWVRD